MIVSLSSVGGIEAGSWEEGYQEQQKRLDYVASGIDTFYLLTCVSTTRKDTIMAEDV